MPDPNQSPNETPKHQHQPPASETRSKLTGLFQRQVLVISLFIIFALVIVLMITLLKSVPLYENLRDPEYARGVITFLIVVAAIGIGLFLTVQTFFGSGTQDEQAEKFRRGREVHSVLVGVMGTIVGFYFGNTERARFELQVAPIQVVFTAKDSKHLTTYASGGTSPYRYSLSFQRVKSDATNAIPTDVTNKFSENGWIAEDFACSTDLKVTLSVTDKTDRRKELSETVKTSATPQPGTAAPNSSPSK